MDYYNVLNITNKATAKEIKNAYRKLAKKYHPDTYEGKKEFAESKMKELNEAYDILSDEAKRKEYDLKNNVASKEEQETTYDYNYTGETRRPDFYNTNYYHYAPAKEEKYNINSIRYDELFKNKVFAAVIAVIIAVLLIVFIAINMISSVIKLLTPTTDTALPPEQNVSQENPLKSFDEWYNTEGKAYEEQIKKEYDEWYETEGKAYEEQLKKEYNKWYETEGKVYEEELNKFLEELEKEINANN